MIPTAGMLDVGIEDIPARLTFLRMLRDRTVFGDHAVLKLIISDYEQAQRVAWNSEERPRRRATDAAALPAPGQAPGRKVSVIASPTPDIVTLRIERFKDLS